MEQPKETIIQKAYDLLKFGIVLVGQFPQKHKFTLGDRMQGHLSDVLEILVEAYYAPPAKKRPMLERVNVLLPAVVGVLANNKQRSECPSLVSRPKCCWRGRQQRQE